MLCEVTINRAAAQPQLQFAQPRLHLSVTKKQH